MNNLLSDIKDKAVLITGHVNPDGDALGSALAFALLLKKHGISSDVSFDIKNALVCPSGVISQKEVLENLEISNREDVCLIYFKKRITSDLEQLIKLERNML